MAIEVFVSLVMKEYEPRVNASHLGCARVRAMVACDQVVSIYSLGNLRLNPGRIDYA